MAFGAGRGLVVKVTVATLLQPETVLVTRANRVVVPVSVNEAGVGTEVVNPASENQATERFVKEPLAMARLLVVKSKGPCKFVPCTSSQKERFWLTTQKDKWATKYMVGKAVICH